MDALVERRRIKRGWADELLRRCERDGSSPEHGLLAAGLSRSEVLGTKAALFGVPAVDLMAHPPPHGAATLLPQAMAERYHAVCADLRGDVIALAMADPSDAFAIEYIAMRTGFKVEPHVALLPDIEAIVAQAHTRPGPSRPAPPALRDRVGRDVMRGRATAPLPGKVTLDDPGAAPRLLASHAAGPAPLIATAPRVALNAAHAVIQEELARLSLDLPLVLDEERVIDRVLDTAAAFRAEAASILLIDWATSTMYVREARGPVRNEIRHMQLPLHPSRSVAGWVATHRAVANIPDVTADPRHYAGIDEATGYVTRNILALPIVWGNDVLGVLELINKPGGFDERDVELAGVLAAHAAVALQNSLAVQQLHNFFQQALEMLIETYQAFDPVQHSHVQDVARLAVAIGTDVGLDADSMETLCYAALLHDIGKIRCADRPDPDHAEVGSQMLGNVTLFSRLVPVVRHHHERYDGSGFPGGLAGDAIPLLARILAVAEAWQEEAGGGRLQSLEAFAQRFGGDFDPDLRAPFERAVSS